MANDLTVALRLTADGKPLVAEVKGAQAAIQQLGPTTQQSAQQATTALRQVEVQARSTSTALATVPAQAGGGLARIATSLGGVPGVLTTVATAAGSAGGAFGSLGTVASALSGGLAGLVATVVSLGVQYAVTALSTDKATDAEKKLAEAMEFAERRMKTSEQVALDLAFAKRRQALATLEAAKAIQAETLAQLQQDLEFAQSGRTSAEELARRPGRVGTMRQRTAATAAENRADDIRDIGRAAEDAAAALRKTEDAIAAVVSPSRDEAARDARTGGRAGREQSALDPFRNFREAALRLEAETRTPLEAYSARLRELENLQTLGGLSQETFNRAVDDATRKFQQASDAAGQAGTGIEGLDRAFESLNESIAGTGRETADYLAKAALGIDQVKFSFDQLAAKFASGVFSRLIQDEITGPLSRALLQMARLGLTSLLGSGGSVLAPASNAQSAANLTAAGPSGLFIPPLHTGGIAGREAPMGMRAVPAEIFRDAPRFHSGGMIGPGEVPAILRRGEGVFTEGQMKALAPAGGGSVTVVVNDYRTKGGEPVQVSERQDGAGGRVIEVLIKDVVTRGLADGSFDRPMRGAFGITRRGA